MYRAVDEWEDVDRAVGFFFQAEDGIRDGRVTGVQTCALPISGNRLVAADEYDQSIKMISARDQFHRVGDHLATDQRSTHALRTHRDAVGNGNRDRKSVV